MKSRLLFLLLTLSQLAAWAQQNYAPSRLPPGGMAFFTSSKSGFSNSVINAESSFSGFEDVYALLVPQIDPLKLPPGNAYLVEVWMDGIRRGEVEILLPPRGPLDDAIAFPVYPSHRDHHLRQLGKLMDLLLEAPPGQRPTHVFVLKVALTEGKLYLGEGMFHTEAGFVGGRFERDKETVLTPAATPQPGDAELQAYLADKMARDYGHLSLRSHVLLAPWQDDPQVAKLKSCRVRYVVQDKAGNCYAGESELKRRVKKTGEFGQIIGEFYPNQPVACE